MTSNKPYLIRAFYDWIADNGQTPYILVSTEFSDDMSVPEQHIKDKKIVLNLSDSAVRNLTLEDEYVSFDARFSGQPMQVYFPVGSVAAIYAMENGEGMAFNVDTESSKDQPAKEEQKPPIEDKKSVKKTKKLGAKIKRPNHLTVVK